MSLRIAAFPRDRNPYQELLYGELRERGDAVRYVGELTPSHSLNLLVLPFELAALRLAGYRIFHLHWTFGFSFTAPIGPRASRRWFTLVLWVIGVLGYRLVWTAHNVLPHEPVFDDDRAARRALVARCALVIAHEPAAIEGLQQIGAVPAGSVIIPHGPFELAGDGEIPPPRGTIPRSLAFVGRVTRYKGVEDLLAAAAGLESVVHVTIAGACEDRVLRQELRQTARGLDGMVSLRLGFQTEAELAHILTEADVVVLPFREITTSGSVLLSLAAGRATVVPDLPALQSLPDSVVFRYPPGVAGLRAALREVAEASPGLLRAKGADARAFALTPTWRSIAQATHDAFTDVVADPGAARPRVITRLVAAVRADALTRNSTLLVLDFLIVGAIGGICGILAAHEWSPHAIGAVGAITGVVTLLSTATSTGVGSTITRFLGGERNQLSFALEAIGLTVVAGLALVAAVSFVPGHFGVPLSDLPVSTPVAFLLLAAYVTASNIVAVTDPAFLSRGEVSYAVVKDIVASLARIGILVALIGTSATGLLSVAIIYGGLSAALDLGLVGWRLRDTGDHGGLLSLRQLRGRLRFAIGSHVAMLVAIIPSALLVTIVAALDNATVAAYVSIPMLVLTYVNIIPAMTSQALLADLSREDVDVPASAVRALRIAYAGARPVAALLIVLAPLVLRIFGHVYAEHGVGFVRWIIAATVFATFNYIGDTVLLARQRVLAYNLVNGLGTVSIMTCVIVGVTLGFGWIGPAWFVGQLLYAVISLITLSRYGSLRGAAAQVRQLAWRV
jgi:glycosyltransferase involved in cell wall biosynthesis/O-antigen/teichoic acid export membrane protein